MQAAGGFAASSTSCRQCPHVTTSDTGLGLARREQAGDWQRRVLTVSSSAATLAPRRNPLPGTTSQPHMTWRTGSPTASWGNAGIPFWLFSSPTVAFGDAVGVMRCVDRPRLLTATLGGAGGSGDASDPLLGGVRRHAHAAHAPSGS